MELPGATAHSMSRLVLKNPSRNGQDDIREGLVNTHRLDVAETSDAEDQALDDDSTILV